jgi:hypothetical protein
MDLQDVCSGRLLKFGGQPLPHGSATNHKLASLVHPTCVGEAEKVESLRFLPPVETPAVPVRKASEPDEACLVRVEFQREPLESVTQSLREACCIILVLESHDPPRLQQRSSLMA